MKKLKKGTRVKLKSYKEVLSNHKIGTFTGYIKNNSIYNIKVNWDNGSYSATTRNNIIPLEG